MTSLSVVSITCCMSSYAWHYSGVALQSRYQFCAIRGKQTQTHSLQYIRMQYTDVEATTVGFFVVFFQF